MLDDILTFSGNRPVFDGLATLVKEHQCVAFVGAGASAGLYPMWNRFIELLADHAVATGKAEPKDAERWKKDTALTPQQRVNTIVRKLGEPLYRDFLRATFSPACGSDGKRYTPSHAALLRLPFRGYVTTNYDPALDFARAELRPDSLSTGTPTWQDDEEVYLWRTGDVFTRDCPMLWLHGCWQRPHGIVLNSGEYSQAYKPGIYRDTCKELWIRERLVFLGFGFNDPQLTFMVGEFLRDLVDANAVPRHIAILGWTMPDDGSAPDPEEIKEKRESLEADYHLRALFYPVKDGDHSALRTLLGGLADACGCVLRTALPVPTPAPPAAAAVFATKWVHETTNDDKFTGRQDELDRLDRWVRDESIRIVAVCAVGGTGKTALVGHWLKNTTGWRSRPFVGLFGWSFYQNRSPDEFLKALLQWAQETFGTPKPDEKTDLVNAAARLLIGRVLVVVLDGLEVLQEGPDDARHGAFLDAGLRELLHALCEDASSQSLAVLTSRFVFADLERHLGTAFHQLELPGLPPDQGARLLDELGVRGPVAEREEVSRRLDGHPLALRVFVESLSDADCAQPRRFLDHAFKPNEVPPGTPLNDKLRRLLGFYDKRLPPDQVRLLTIVALFRSPVTEETLLRLARGLFTDTTQPLPDDAALSYALTVLNARGILSREPIEGGHGYACHPILRDHFRAVLLGTGADTARRAADLLTGQPSNERPQSVKEIEPVLLAIELLLDAGEFKAADELYRGRLKNGWTLVNVPALTEGLACASAFVGDEKRGDSVQATESAETLNFYISWAGLLAGLSGRVELAREYFEKRAQLVRRQPELTHATVGGLYEPEILVFAGLLSDAERHASSEIKGREAKVESLGRLTSEPIRGWARCLRGSLFDALVDFRVADKIDGRRSGARLYGGAGVFLSELFLRTLYIRRAVSLTEANLALCESQGWNDDVGKCRWMLAACALAEGRLDDAAAAIELAESIFHRGQLLFWLSRLHLTAGTLALARHDVPGALHRVTEALALAQPRGMKLVHADALVLRGRARLFGAKPDCAVRALDDSTDALRLARECSYAWAERDSLFLEADARTTLASVFDQTDSARATRERTAATKARAEAQALAKKLVLTEEDLAQADREAEAWLAECEKQKAAKDAKA